MKNTKLLIYTFRTFPQLEELQNLSPDVFIFGKLKEDLRKFQILINNVKPQLVIGIANSKAASRLEISTINKFNQKNKINKAGKDKYDLYLPKILSKNFSSSKSPGTTFCNWTTYKISEILENKNTNLSFIHINSKDMDLLLNLLKEIE